MRYETTVDMTREQWFARRYESIGASEAAAVLGLSPFQSRVDVWLQKVNKQNPIPDNLAMWLGRELEPVLKKRFEEETGKKVRNDYKIRIDPEHAFLTTNLDGMVVDEKVPIEYKTTASWGGEIPDFYFCQLQHQMMVTGAEYLYYAVLVLGKYKQFIIEKYNRHEKFIAEMRENLVDFWQNNVITGVMPEPENEDGARKLYTINTDDVVYADSDMLGMIEKLEKVTDNKIKLEKDISVIKGDIMNVMREKSAVLLEDGTRVVSWKKTKDRNGLDIARLRIEMPDIYNKFIKTKEGYRRFSLSPPEK